MGEANQEGSATTWRTRVRSTMRVLGYVSKELVNDAPLVAGQLAVGTGVVVGLGAIEGSILLSRAVGSASVSEALRYGLATALPSLAGPGTPSFAELYLRATPPSAPAAPTASPPAAAPATTSAASKEAVLCLSDPRLSLRLRKLQAARQAVGILTIATVAWQVGCCVEKGRERYRKLILAGREVPLTPVSHLRLARRLTTGQRTFLQAHGTLPVLLTPPRARADAAGMYPEEAMGGGLVPYYWRCAWDEAGRQAQWAPLLARGNSSSVLVVEALPQPPDAPSIWTQRREHRCQHPRDGARLPLPVILEAFRALGASASPAPIRVLLSEDADDVMCWLRRAGGEEVVDVAIDASAALAQAVAAWARDTAYARAWDGQAQDEQEEQDRHEATRLEGRDVSAAAADSRSEALLRLATQVGERALDKSPPLLRRLWVGWESLGRRLRSLGRDITLQRVTEPQQVLSRFREQKVLVLVTGVASGEQATSDPHHDATIAKVASALRACGWAVHTCTLSLPAPASPLPPLPLLQGSYWSPEALHACPAPVLLLLPPTQQHHALSGSTTRGREVGSTCVVVDGPLDAAAQGDDTHWISRADMREQLLAFVRSRLHHYAPSLLSPEPSPSSSSSASFMGGQDSSARAQALVSIRAEMADALSLPIPPPPTPQADTTPTPTTQAVEGEAPEPPLQRQTSTSSSDLPRRLA